MGSKFSTHIVTQKWTVGPYTFIAWMPRVGTSGDIPVFTVELDGEQLDGVTCSTLEAALRYAADYGDRNRAREAGE